MHPLPARPREKPRRSLTAELRESLRHTRMTLALVWRSSPPQTVALGVLTLVGGLVPLGVAYAGKRIVDAVVAHDHDATLRWVLVELALVVALALVQRGLASSATCWARASASTSTSTSSRRRSASTCPPSRTRSSTTSSRARVARRPRDPSRSSPRAFGLVQSLITLVGYGALLVRFSGWAVLALCVATVPATIAEMRFSKLAFKTRNWRSPESRRLMYLEYVLANDEHAKEVKLFGLGPTAARALPAPERAVLRGGPQALRAAREVDAAPVAHRHRHVLRGVRGDGAAGRRRAS